MKLIQMDKKENSNKIDSKDDCTTSVQDKDVLSSKQSTHSGSFNFLSYLKDGVDPRNGDYTVSIDAESKSSKES